MQPRIKNPAMIIPDAGQAIGALVAAVRGAEYGQTGNGVHGLYRIVTPVSALCFPLLLTALLAGRWRGAWAAAAGQPALVTSTVAEVTGSPARPFMQWATHHSNEFRC